MRPGPGSTCDPVMRVWTCEVVVDWSVCLCIRVQYRRVRRGVLRCLRFVCGARCSDIVCALVSLATSPHLVTVSGALLSSVRGRAFAVVFERGAEDGGN